MTAQEILKHFMIPYKAKHGINYYKTTTKLKKAGFPLSVPYFWAILGDKPYVLSIKQKCKLYTFFQIPFTDIDGVPTVDAYFLEQLELEQQAKND